MKGIEAWNSVPFCRASNVTGELDGGLYPLIMWKLCSAQVTISSESDGGPNPLIIVKCDLMTSYTCCWTRTSSCMHITEYIGLYDAVMPRYGLPGIHEPCSASMNPLPPSPAAYIMTSTGQSPTLDIVILYRHNLPILSSPRNIRLIFPVVCEWLQCASGTRINPIQWSGNHQSEPEFSCEWKLVKLRIVNLWTLGVLARVSGTYPVVSLSHKCVVRQQTTKVIIVLKSSVEWLCDFLSRNNQVRCRFGVKCLIVCLGVTVRKCQCLVSVVGRQCKYFIFDFLRKCVWRVRTRNQIRELRELRARVLRAGYSRELLYRFVSSSGQVVSVYSQVPRPLAAAE